MTSPAARLRRPPHVLVRELEGEAVLLHLDDERYFGLDEVGTRMWAVLTTVGSVAAASQALSAEFDVDPKRLDRDLKVLVEELLAHGLLEVLEDLEDGES